MITENEIKKLAILAKLEVKEDEIPDLLDKIELILKYAKSLEGIESEEKNTENYRDFSQLRADEVTQSFDREEIISNAFEKEDGFFKLRKRNENG